MLLSCPLCCKPHFEGVDSLRTTLINVATAPLTCPVCHESLMGLDKLTIHLFGHVSSNQGACKQKYEEGVANGDCCGEEIPEGYPDLVADDAHKNINRICTDTVPPEITPELVKATEKVHDEIITCDICSFNFNDKNILEMHQKLLHQTSPDEKTGKYSYHCHLCSKRFRMRGSLMVHLRVAHYGFNNHVDLPPHLLNNKRNQTTDMEKSKMEMDAENSSSKPDFKQWSCDVCAKMFTTKYFLKKHKRLHTGEMPYSCTICNKSFTFQQSYHKHMLYHTSEKPYVCNECGRAFKEHSTLQNHARIHSGERPFACEICGKRFRQRVSYLVHMRIHTGVMPYKCTACDKSFRYKVSQKSHKCPVDPPGSVVRVGDSDPNTPTSPSNPNVVGNQTGSSFNTFIDSEGAVKGPKCIMSVDYNTGNINLIPKIGKIPLNQRLHQSEPVCTGVIEQGVTINNDHMIHQRDIYSIAMSPLLPEVESLCLNSNNSPVSNPASPLEENIQIIREKCLEELFK